MSKPSQIPLTPYLNAEYRYQNDATFHGLVDGLTSIIARLEMTPAEVREAAIYACIRFEHLNMRQMRIPVGPLPQRELEDMQREADACELRAHQLKVWLRGGE